MASSNTGGWVRRVGASGGGRAYRRRRPVNYYGLLSLVVVLGFGSVVLARYDYQHPKAAKPKTPSLSWFVALGVDACGKQLAPLQGETASQPSGVSLLTGGVVWVKSLSTSKLGAHPSAKALNLLPGFALSSTALDVPKRGHAHAVQYTAGSVCPKGTPDAGKVGRIEIATWPSVAAVTPTIATDPSKAPLGSEIEMTVAFIPKGATPLRPPAGVVRLMYEATASPPSPTTSTTSTTTTTVPKSTSTSSSTSTSTSTTSTTSPSH